MGWGVCLRNGSEDTKAIADETQRKPVQKMDGQIIWKRMLFSQKDGKRKGLI